MPWAGGTFTRNNGTYSGSTVWQSDAAAAIKIRADRHDNHDQDLATGINNCLTKDGQNSPTQNSNWGGFKITNLGNGTASSDAAAYGQTITALGWSGNTITATRAAGNLTITVSAANIGATLGYTPASDAYLITALSWSGATITATRTIGNLTLSVTSANITSSLGYTPANKAGETFTGKVQASGRMFIEDGGNATLPTGKALAMFYMTAVTGDYAGIVAYDYGASAYKPMQLEASSFSFNNPVTIGGGRKISKVTLSTAAPGVLADGELYLQY